ncbi:hypothetical protein GCM10022631_11760 [Deinococcus rubellus]|uniref:Uncharacterized protein n=1 Tax=Deinococcus rubellus TaxID=1889240 RepID=A0ABY5YCL2_9DEIO|nr:hypothetical protein [Deinococcus rubellus]UWX62779.1 hypothetical protein N0D28_08330 [Deinococcus rubellus]
MAIDARPFLTLTDASGGTIRCSRPKLIPLTLGVSSGRGGVAADTPTHTVDVYVALGTPPAGLEDNALVTVDVEPGKLQTFRILRNGIGKKAGTWKLYVRTEEDEVLA